MKITTARVSAIDAFRGITILTMIFVNELAGVSGMPVWMKHMPANADAMTFVDVVFPAFLFIVGMSIPFAIQRRLLEGDSVATLQRHIILRSVGLLVLGVFMVNAEGGYHEETMAISIHLWSFLFCVAAILIWNDYTFQKNVVYLLRASGVIILVILAGLYRGGDTGTEYITPKWWGILGLIGWAYLISCVFYQLFRGRIVAMIMLIGTCTAYYCMAHWQALGNTGWAHSLLSQGGHAAHTSIVLSGVVLSLLFFDETKKKIFSKRCVEAFAFALFLFSSGYFLRPYFKISKIYATPTWCLYSSAICVVLFIFLYWLIDVRKISAWTSFFRPAASNALLTYLIPYFVYEILSLSHISLPEYLYDGIPGLIWALTYAVIVMGIVIVLNKLKIRLRL